MRMWVIRGLIAIFGATLLVAPLSSLAAQQPSGASANGSAGQGLEISPPVIELSADPGQTVTANIRIRNVTAGELIAKGKADDFGAGDDETGKPKLLLDETGATRYSLKYWVTGVPDLRLAPQEVKKATVTITVPKNAEPGGHFGVVRFTAVPPNLEGTGVALSASIGTLVLLKVSGEIKNNASVVEFSAGEALKDSFVKHSFFEHGPVAFLIRLRNEGTVHEKATGSIVVTDTFGGKVATVAVNATGGNVLPDSIRRFVETLDKKQLFGHYTAKLALLYAGDKKLEAQLGFWVIPWKLILLILVGLTVLFYLMRFGLRRYNEYIIAQAKKR